MKLCFRVKYLFFYLQKIKENNFIVVVTLLNFSYTSRFSSPLLFNVLLVSLVTWRIFIIFRWLKSFWWFFFQFEGKSHYRQLQVLIILTKELLWIFLASPTQRTHHKTFWVFFLELLLMNVSKNSVHNCFSFALVSNYW